MTEAESAAESVGTRPDPRAYARILWRWKFLLLAILVVVPLGTYLYESSRPKVYQARVLTQVTGGQQLGVASLLNQAPSGPDVTDLQADARLITTTGVARQAARYLQPPPANPRSLAGSVSASADQNTNFITITAKASTARRAAAVANAFAQAIAATQTHAAAKDVAAAIAQLKRQLNNLPPGDPSRAQISGQIARFHALRAAQASDVVIVDPATPPSSAIAPRVTRSVVLALIVALLLGLGAVAIAEAADRRIRHPDEVGEFAGLPLLSAIPDSSFSLDDESAASIESFVTLRSSLTYFNVDQGLSSVLVTSPGKEDGKTTVSIKLARALARAGRDVILIDADLRRPAIAKRLGFPSSVGLGQVLAGDFTLDQVISDEAAPAGGRLRVLTAGRPVPTPSELLGSRRMLELMSKLSERCDIVIIDSTPLLTVSDSMPLLRAVSGVVLVARVNRTSREAIARLRTVVDSAGGKPLGVVTTGTRRGGLYVAPGYGYESAYTSGPGVAANGNGMPGRRSRWRPWAGRGDAKRVGVSEDE